MNKYFFTTLISVVLFLLSFMTADTGVVTMLKSFCLLTVMLWSAYCYCEERKRKSRNAKIKAKIKAKARYKSQRKYTKCSKNAKVTNGNSNADAELHNEVYDDTQIEAMSLELINILSDAYYGNAKCISYSCDKGNFTTDNGMNYHINTGLIPIITILKKLKIYYSADSEVVTIALTAFGENYEGV